MPQLAKGGKWVFGWVVVGENNMIQIPPEAFEEYGFSAGETVYFISGSRTSGGFGLGRKSLIENSVLHPLRVLNIGQIETNRRIIIPAGINIDPGQSLLTCRGSYVALGFLKQGPIIEEAKNHPELETYLP